MILLASILAGGLIAWFLFPYFFGTLDDFFDCLNNFGSVGIDRQWAKLKLTFYFGISVMVGFMTHYSLQKYFN